MYSTKSIFDKPCIFELPVLKNMGLHWKRGKSDTTLVSKRMIWETKCKQYRVVKSKIIYGDLSIIYYAMINNNGLWDIISKHRKKSTAQKACEQHYKKAHRGMKGTS